MSNGSEFLDPDERMLAPITTREIDELSKDGIKVLLCTRALVEKILCEKLSINHDTATSLAECLGWQCAHTNNPDAARALKVMYQVKSVANDLFQTEDQS